MKSQGTGNGTRSASRRFLVYFGSFFFLGLLLCGGFNSVVDPRGYLWWRAWEGLNSIKPHAKGSRTEKALRLRQQSYQVLIAGSSRIQVGIDPRHAVFAGRPAYNLGVSRNNMVELGRSLQYARRHQQPQLLIVGLDFLLFSSRRQVSGDFHRSHFAKERAWGWLLDYGATARVLRESVETLRFNRQLQHRQRRAKVEGQTAPEAWLGHSDRHGLLHRSQLGVDHGQAFRDVLRRNFFVDTYAGFAYGSGRLRTLARSLSAFRSDEVPVLLFISPVHAWQLQALHAMDLYGTFERWKEDLVRTVEELNRQESTGPAVELWDFSGFGPLREEAVPKPGSSHRMRWYWECSHYKVELGNLVLERLFGQRASVANGEGFGVRLHSDDLGAHLAQQRLQLRDWQARHPEDVQTIAGLLQDTAAERQRRWGGRQRRGVKAGGATPKVATPASELPGSAAPTRSGGTG